MLSAAGTAGQELLSSTTKQIQNQIGDLQKKQDQPNTSTDATDAAEVEVNPYLAAAVPKDDSNSPPTDTSDPTQSTEIPPESIYDTQHWIVKSITPLERIFEINIKSKGVF